MVDFRTARACVALVVGTAVAAEAAPAQTASPGLPPVFELLEGEWIGEGSLFGQAARFDMTWRLTDGAVANLDFENALVDDTGTATTVLTASARYSLSADGTIVAEWEDSRGESIRIEATATAAVLASNWTSPSETGRTEYAVHADGTVLVTDWVISPTGEPREFGRAVYRRR